MKFISPAVHISSGCGKPHRSYLYRLQFHVSPSDDTPAPSSCWYGWPPFILAQLLTLTPLIFLHGCPPKNPQALSLLGQIPDALAHGNTSVTRVSQHPAKPQCQELTVSALWMTLLEFSKGIGKVSRKCPVLKMLREPAETRGQSVTKWANCKHQSIYKHW